MTLKDRLTEALNATADTHRKDILTAALNAGDTDADVAEALDRLIDAREQKAAQLEKSGQPDLAAAERAEAASLRLLRAPEGAAAVTGPKAASSAPGKKGPLFTRRQMYLGGAALAAGLIALVVTLNPFGDKDDLSAAPAAQKVSVFNDDRTMGNPKAPITLVEYAAPMCPHCARFMAEEFPVLKRDFIDTGKVFYIFRVFPLGAPDGAIEGIARCLPKERYFPFMEMMFRNQSAWDPDGYQIPDVAAAIVKLAASEGITPDRAKQCMADTATQERVNQVAQDAQVRYQIEGTPTFVMDGQVVNMPPGKTALEVLRLRINSVSGGQSQ